jgi:hypothetical protein
MLGPTTSGLTLVEPTRELAARDGAITLMPAGSLAMVESGEDGKLHFVDCATSCGNPATWSGGTLDPHAAWSSPLIRSTDDGALVAVVDHLAPGDATELLGFCTANCTADASWAWHKVTLPADATAPRAPSRYFAVGGRTMILGLGAGTPMSALVCGGTCDHDTSWARMQFSNATCSAPSVAASPTGAMAFACVTTVATRNPAQAIEVWSCPGDCTNQSNWGGVDGVATGTDLAVDLTVGPGGMVGAAVHLGPQSNAVTANHLGWFQCAGGCAQPGNWHGTVVGAETLYARRVAAITDQQGRSVIAYDGVSSAGSGLLTAACTADCLKNASWSVALLDDAKRIAGQIPLAAPSGCDAAAWVPDNVTDITMRGDWAAITSGYSAVGTGGTCGGDPAASLASGQPIRSVVSVAVLGP